MKQIREKLHKCVSFLLALVMVLSLFDASMLTVLAANPAPVASDATEGKEESADVSDPTAKTKPTLFVDFLGDTTTGGTYGASGGIPTNTDRSASQSATKDPAGTWDKYTLDFPDADANGTGYGDTVFWVGVGIDKMKLFKLVQDGEKGLSGLELGFYYNPDYVVPYMGKADRTNVNGYTSAWDADYKDYLAGENLASSPDPFNQWDSRYYHIEQAIPVMNPVVDNATQEYVVAREEEGNPVKFDPVAEGWKMLYVSLERNLTEGRDWDAADNRFADLTAVDNDDIYYVMMLPFVLKDYDANEEVCFRLARNASVFSMGGARYGAGSYDSENDKKSTFGAWEISTRTPKHNLKDMFDFEGDLNIFKGRNEYDTAFTATLVLENWSTDNGAVLYPTEDPSAFVNTGDGDASPYGVLYGLTEGTELTLDIDQGSGSGVSVSITADGNPITPTEVSEGEKYTFSMPAKNVIVTVHFDAASSGGGEESKDLKVYLKKEGDDDKEENVATISGYDSTDPAPDAPNSTSVSGGVIAVKTGNQVTVHVETHPDYKVTVEAYLTTGNEVILEAPDEENSDYRFTMPSTADVLVTATYEKYSTYEVRLAVQGSSSGSTDNKARVSFTAYDGRTTPPTSVEGVQSVTDGADNFQILQAVPESRKVKVEIAAADGYIASSIYLYDKVENNYTNQKSLPTLQEQEDAGDGYTKYTEFEMPGNDVEVYVIFTKLQNYNAKLILQDDDGTDPATYGTGQLQGNKNNTDGNTVDGDLQKTDMDATPPVNTITILSNNKVVLDMIPNDGYKVKSVTIRTDDPYTPTLEQYTGTIEEDSTPSQIVFNMPDANIEVTVVFEEMGKERYNATIVLEPFDDISDAVQLLDGETAKTGWVGDTTEEPVALDYPTKPSSATLPGNVVGSTLTAWIQVKPGWYIASSKLIGRDMSPMGTGTGSGETYPILSMSGNGYNNGKGGQVIVTLKQPAEDVSLYLDMKKGRPQPEPSLSLTLAVNDPDGKAGNRAWIRLNNAAERPSGGVYSKYNDGNGYTIANTTAGDDVQVNWNVEEGYYVSKVVVSPSGHGITPVWTSASSIRFNQPAGAATVTVYYKKIDPANPPYTATLHIRNAVAGEGTTLTSGNIHATNSPQALTSSGMADMDATSIPAWPGDIFTTSTTTSRYFTVDVYQGGNLIPWAATVRKNGRFVMPAGNTDVYVTFWDSLPVGKPLTLTATGPALIEPGVAGLAELYVDDGTGTIAPISMVTSTGAVAYQARSSEPTMPSPVRGYVSANTTVRVKAIPNAGYIINYIRYTPAGAVSPVELAMPAGVGSREVEFAMPADATAVEVHFIKGSVNDMVRHMANIVIIPPEATPIIQPTTVGDAWFEGIDPVHTTTNSGPFSASVAAGTDLKVKARAFNGYYIDRIEINPVSLDVASPITGIFGMQDMSFKMPNADCLVNIYYKKGWPDGLYARLNVFGSTDPANTNQAEMYSDNATPVTTGSVLVNGSAVLDDIAPGDIVRTKITPDAGFSVDYPIVIKDATEAIIPYWWSNTDEIAFYMPGTWVSVNVTFKEGSDTTDYKATLVGGTGSESLTSNGSDAVINPASTEITHLHPGNEVKVYATGVHTGKIPVVTAYAVSTHTPIIMPLPVETPEASGTYVTNFYMPEDDAEVHVDYVDYVNLPDTNEYIGKLIATQTNGVSSGGSAQMYQQNNQANTTSRVSSVGSSAHALEKDKPITIEAAPNTGFVVQSVMVIRDDNGELVPVTLTGVSEGTSRYEYTMPNVAVTAVVTFREKTAADSKLRAQVVVNNAGNSQNKAVIYRGGSTGETAEDGTTMLTSLSPTDEIMVDIAVITGYEIDLVMISPNLGGGETIQVSPTNQSQTVSFRMPADDVVVYVRYRLDNKIRYNITLKVGDTIDPMPTKPYNTATIHTNYSGTKGPIHDGDAKQTVKGAATEVVTVKLQPYDLENYNVTYYAVVTAVLDGTKIPVGDLTVSPDGLTYTFSVPHSNVNVEVTYYPSSVPKPTHKVMLHIANADGSDPQTAVWGNYANTYVKNTDATPNKTTIWSDMTLENVPYLEPVTVNAEALSGKYIQSVYAMSNGVTLEPLGDAGYSDTLSSNNLVGRNFDFLMQNNDVHVYVVFTDTPPVYQYSVALTVVGPTGSGEIAGKAGSAILTNASDSSISPTRSVPSNAAFDAVTDIITVGDGQYFDVQVKVNTGYTLDTVVVTPFARSVFVRSTPGILKYRFKMCNPPADLSVLVTFRKPEEEGENVTLKLTDDYLEPEVQQTDAAQALNSINKTDVNYSVTHLPALDEENNVSIWSMEVPEKEKVTIKVEPGVDTDVEPNQPYYVHHAFAVTKAGAVLPLREYSEGITNLQNLEGPAKGQAKFVMPKKSVDVYVRYTDAPAIGDHSAVLTVTDPTYSGQSQVKMTETTLKESVVASSNGNLYGPISTNAGDRMVLSWATLLAQGCGVSKITITGGEEDVVYTVGDGLEADSTQLAFDAPDYDIGVIVELDNVELPTYKATLHIVDHSSSMSNQVAMKELGTTSAVTTDGATITGLSGGTTVSTNVTPDSTGGVVVRAVIATDICGSYLLEPASGFANRYDYTLSNHDVDITVVFDNAPTASEMYVAMVQMAGEYTLVGNTAKVKNTTNPALPNGKIWTGIYAENRVQVNVTTELGYYAVITAETADSHIDIPVLQLGAAGTVKGYLDVPVGLSENVIITVDYQVGLPTDTNSLTLALVGTDVIGANAGNQAVLQDVETSGATVNLTAIDNGAEESAIEDSVVVGSELRLTTTPAAGSGWYVEKVTLSANGISVELDQAGEKFLMPYSDATVTVTLASGARTPRPHDWVQHNHPGSRTNYVEGYLKAQNLSDNCVHIVVPNLYDKTNTTAANDENVEYNLYIEDGGNYTLLKKGEDYDVINYNAYTPTEVDNTNKLAGEVGWEFTIRSMKGECALTELMLLGGTLYITATDINTPKAESERVEVVVPRDKLKRDHFTATLKIVDNSGVVGNIAQMSDGLETVDTDGDVITELWGNELIRTVVYPAPGARVSAVTVTNGVGTWLLDEVPVDMLRFPYYMTDEDIIITVYFEMDKSEPLTRYIAAVAKMGASAVEGNGAKIQNDTRSDLEKGNIWAEGHMGNNMRVTVTLAEGYYATLTAVNKKNPSEAVVVTAFGCGPGESGGSSFDAIFAMPDSELGQTPSDVQVIVTYTKEKPDNVENDLILDIAGNDGLSDNWAKLTENATDSPRILDTSVTNPPITESGVAAGTKFKLTTNTDTTTIPSQPYYVKRVKVSVYDKTNTYVITTYRLNLDINGEADFVMPKGKTVVQVIFSNVPRLSRPYDPKHSETYYSATATADGDYVIGGASGINPDRSSPTQEGWVLANAAAPKNDLNRIKVVLPTLHNDESTDTNVLNALSDAGQSPNDLPEGIGYRFYWKDSYDNYHRLSNISVTAIEPVMTPPNVQNTYTLTAGGEKTVIGYELTIQANQRGGLMDYYIENGGTIYAVATDTSNSAALVEDSDYTQVVITKLYRATLHYTPLNSTTDQTAKMYDDIQTTISNPIIDDGDYIGGMDGRETVKVDISNPYPSDATTSYTPVGVVATTENGSMNATRTADDRYAYDMTNAMTGTKQDVELTVVYNDVNDPLKSKGPHIVTVMKLNDDGMAGNRASVEDVDVDIPDDMRGADWTVAYEGNVVRVNYATESGYYVQEVKAEKVNGDSGTVNVIRYGSYALFYMPDDADVNVTVTYTTGTAISHTLNLIVLDTEEDDNTATVTFPDDSTLTATGVDRVKYKPDIAADSVLEFETETVDNTWRVASTKLQSNDVSVDVPLIDGKALPDIIMPYGSAVIVTRFENTPAAPRPYDPIHSELYNGSEYTIGGDADKSSTHQEGWIYAKTLGADSFEVEIPTLYDYTVDTADDNDKLSDAWASATEPVYTFYWLDSLGNFQVLDDADITIQRRVQMPVADSYSDSGDTTYAGTLIKVGVNTAGTPAMPNLWGGYKLLKYLASGGSIYVTATNTAGVESEKTEVVFAPKSYTATLIFEPPTGEGTGADMTDGITTVSDNGGQIRNLNGSETITVKNIVSTDDYIPVGVVATTRSSGILTGSVNADYVSDTEYTYDMQKEDVELRVVYNKTSDPLKSKGPYIVTVLKTDHDNEPDNNATVVDMDVDIPAEQRGNIWTVAYEGNVVMVNVTVADGYYAEVTAKGKTSGNSVDLVQLATFTDNGTFNGCTAAFAMLDEDVDVTVKYIKGPLPQYNLELVVVEDVDTSPAYSDNKATIAFADQTTLVSSGDDTSNSSVVTAGSTLELTTSSHSGWSVKSVKMRVNNVDVDIPITDGNALPVPTMPFADAVITVTYQNQVQIGRPYDANHSELYNGTAVGGDYTSGDTTGDNPDLSSVHQDGWIMASAVTEDGFRITVPALYDYTVTTIDDRLSDALAPVTSADIEDNYKLYWRDDIGRYHEFEDGVDVDFEHVGTTSIDPLTGKVGYTFQVTVKQSGTPLLPTLWNGYKLLNGYLANGGSIYISALDVTGVKAESEKTEVVILEQESDLRPFDPDRIDTSGKGIYEDNWIRAENRGDYLVVTVPMLNVKDGTMATAEEIDDTKHRFQLYLQIDGDHKSSEKIILTDVVDIINVRDFDFKGPGAMNLDYDAEWRSDASYTAHAYDAFYENEEYYTDRSGAAYHGAKFIVRIKPAPNPDDYTNGALDPDYISDLTAYNTAASVTNRNYLESIFRNDGTMGEDKHRMYITCDEPSNPTASVSAFAEDDYVDFEVPRYYSLQGILESYAPTHVTTFSLYPLDMDNAPDPADSAYSGVGGVAAYVADYNAYAADGDNYLEDPSFRFTNFRESGAGLWQDDFSLNSSALMGDDVDTGVVYKLVIEKVGHVTMTWAGVELKNDTRDDPADDDCLTFTVATIDDEGKAVKDGTDVAKGVIALFGGDADGDDHVRIADYYALMRYFGGGLKWSRDKLNTDSKWDISTYNPESLAYVADLDGDSRITMGDAAIWNIPRNMAKYYGDYDGHYALKQVVLQTPALLSVLSAELDLEDKSIAELEKLLQDETLTEFQKEQIQTRIDEIIAEQEAEAKAAAWKVCLETADADALAILLEDDSLTKEQKAQVQSKIDALNPESAVALPVTEQDTDVVLTSENARETVSTDLSETEKHEPAEDSDTLEDSGVTGDDFTESDGRPSGDDVIQPDDAQEAEDIYDDYSQDEPANFAADTDAEEQPADEPELSTSSDKVDNSSSEGEMEIVANQSEELSTTASGEVSTNSVETVAVIGTNAFTL